MPAGRWNKMKISWVEKGIQEVEKSGFDLDRKSINKKAM
jgi:hypothetical protein